MTGTLKKDTAILIPNVDHKNFTESGKIIEGGTTVKGKITKIQGLRRGQPFTYTLFLTDNNQLIFLNNIKMDTTEVTLGADSAQTATVVNIPNTKKMLTKTVVISSVIGLGIGYAYAKKKGAERNKTIIYTVVGGVAGFLIGKYMETRKAIKVTPSK